LTLICRWVLRLRATQVEHLLGQSRITQGLHVTCPVKDHRGIRTKRPFITGWSMDQCKQNGSY